MAKKLKGVDPAIRKMQALRNGRFSRQIQTPRLPYGSLKRKAQERPRIAYVESVRLNQGATDLDQNTVVEALRARGYDVDIVKWDQQSSPVDWQQYSVVFHGSPWSNWRNMPKYLAFVDHLERLGVKQINPPNILHKGSSKEYLLELAEEGVNIIPTKVLRFDAEERERFARSLSVDGKSKIAHKRTRNRLPRPKPGELADLFVVDGVAYQEIVIKPLTAGGAGGAARYRRDQALEAFRRVQAMHYFEKIDAVVEPYIAAVEETRELSQIITKGKLTHASTKPYLLEPDQEPGALRQSHPDKQPHKSTPQEVAFAEQVWDAMKRRYGLSDSDDISIRVDSIDGKLLEIELIAPVKSFDAVGGAGLEEFLDMVSGAANHEFALRRLGADQFETMTGRDAFELVG